LGYVVPFVLLPLVLLVVLELALRLVGYGEDRSPFVSFEHDGETYFAPNKAFYQQFEALPVEFVVAWDNLTYAIPARKPTGALRVFVLGASAAEGVPHDEFSFPRVVELMLRDRFPGRPIEMYNTAFPGVNSHVMWAMAKACAKLEPDLFIIYMGNNEFGGPYGPTTVLGRHPGLYRLPFIRAHIQLSRLRLMQLLTRRHEAAWKMSQENTIYGNAPTADARAVALYRSNLESICNTAHAAGASTILCTLAYNVAKDSPAGAAEPVAVERARAAEYVLTGAKVLTRVLMRRASPINQAILDVAADRERQGVRLADVATAIARSVPEGIPGYECFHDAVHFTFPGNYLVGRSVFNHIMATLADAEDDRVTLSYDACAERLGWQPAVELDQLRSLMGSFLLDDRDRAACERRIAAITLRLVGNVEEGIADAYCRAVELNPEDAIVRYRYAAALRRLGREDAAIEQASACVNRFPLMRPAYLALAAAQSSLENWPAAVDTLEKLLAFAPDSADAWFEYARANARLDKAADALDACEQALRIHPKHIRAKCLQGAMLEGLGRARAARRVYLEAIPIAPQLGLPYAHLDALLEKGDPGDRVALWRRLVRQYGDRARPHFHLAKALDAAGDFEAAVAACDRAIAIDGTDPEFYETLGLAYLARGEHEKAIPPLREALKRSPQSDYLHPSLAKALCEAGDLEGAREEAAACRAAGLEVDPEVARKLGLDTPNHGG